MFRRLGPFAVQRFGNYPAPSGEVSVRLGGFWYCAALYVRDRSHLYVGHQALVVGRLMLLARFYPA